MENERFPQAGKAGSSLVSGGKSELVVAPEPQTRWTGLSISTLSKRAVTRVRAKTSSVDGAPTIY